MPKVFNVQNFSTGDGKGIRTTVFLNGCNLHCPWCHNPECFNSKKEVSTEEIMEKILHDKAYYEMSGGGVTLSGGEPLLRFNECTELMETIKKQDLHISLDTALCVKIPDFDKLTSLVDTFLVDLKTMDKEKMEFVIGGNLEQYCTNVSELKKRNAEVVFRLPLIPGFNTDDKSIEENAAFINKYGYKVSFHPFHRMGSSKYRELGMDYLYKDTPLLTKEEVAAIKAKYFALGVTEADL